MKLLKGNVGENLNELGLGYEFSDCTIIITHEIIDKLINWQLAFNKLKIEYYHIQSPYSIKRMKWQAID